MVMGGPLSTQIAIFMFNKPTVLIQQEAGWIPEPGKGKYLHEVVN
jgi:hypothetical protein